jgi:hypothetical protein
MSRTWEIRPALALCRQLFLAPQLSPTSRTFFFSMVPPSLTRRAALPRLVDGAVPEPERLLLWHSWVNSLVGDGLLRQRRARYYAAVAGNQHSRRPEQLGAWVISKLNG